MSLVAETDYTVYVNGKLLVNEYNSGEIVVIHRETGVTARIDTVENGLRVTSPSSAIELRAHMNMPEILILDHRLP